MKMIWRCMLVLVVAGASLVGAGCGQKSDVRGSADPQAKQLLIEGTVFLKQGDVVKAVQNFAAAIKTSPDYLDAYLMLSETFIHLKQFDQAQAVLQTAANRFPENPVPYYLLSVAYEGSGNLMPAIVMARKSMDLFQARKDDEGEKRSTVLLGVLVQMAKQQQEAKSVDSAAAAAALSGGK